MDNRVGTDYRGGLGVGRGAGRGRGEKWETIRTTVIEQQ